jgi:peptide/nickel transport system substrate-binding protein
MQKNGTVLRCSFEKIQPTKWGTPMKQKLLRGGLASLTMLVLVGAAHAQNNNSTPTPGGTAVLLVGSIDTLNPTVNTGGATITVGCLMHDGLVELKGDGGYEPALAKSWALSEDGLTYTFDLVETNWHDGQPFTSKDVAFFMKEVTKYAPLISAQVGGKIKDVEILGDHKVSVQLTEPYGPFLSMLACFNGGAMLPEHIYAGSFPPNNPASQAPIGTGPYKFVDWQAGDAVRMTKNEDYYREGLPYLDGVVVRPIPNSAARVQALLAGEGDFIQRFYLPTNDINTIRSNPAFKTVQSSSPPNLTLGFFNVTRKPFDDKRVRQALFSVIDRDFIAKAVYSGHGQPAQAPFGHLLGWAGHPGLSYDKMYPNDPAAAEKLLDEAGLVKGANGVRFTTSISFGADSSDELALATSIQQAWKKIGVETELRPVERPVLLGRVFEQKDYDVSLWVYTTFGDPAIGIARTYISSAQGRAYGNGALYSNPKVDELFARGAAASNLDERAKYYQEVQEILADDMPVMTLFETRGFDAMTAKMEGIFGYMSNGRWSHAWFAK